MDFDECFAAAGYTEFADSGGGRLDEINEMTGRLIASLTGLGAPSRRLGRVPVWAGSPLVHWLRAMVGGLGPAPTLTDIVVCPMMDGAFGACVIDFGDGPAASLCTSDGHEIWWLYLSAGVSARAPALIDVLAGGRSVRHVELDLTPLTPVIRGRVQERSP